MHNWRLRLGAQTAACTHNIALRITPRLGRFKPASRSRMGFAVNATAAPEMGTCDAVEKTVRPYCETSRSFCKDRLVVNLAPRLITHANAVLVFCRL